MKAVEGDVERVQRGRDVENVVVEVREVWEAIGGEGERWGWSKHLSGTRWSKHQEWH